MMNSRLMLPLIFLSLLSLFILAVTNTGCEWLDEEAAPDTVVVLPDTLPEVVSPADGEEDVTISLTLAWVVPHYGDFTYDVYLGESEEDLELLVEGLSTSSLDLSFYLIMNTRYYWRVVVHTQGGGVYEGEIWQFHTIALNGDDENIEWVVGLDRNVHQTMANLPGGMTFVYSVDEFNIINDNGEFLHQNNLSIPMDCETVTDVIGTQDGNSILMVGTYTDDNETRAVHIIKMDLDGNLEFQINQTCWIESSYYDSEMIVGAKLTETVDQTSVRVLFQMFYNEYGVSSFLAHPALQVYSIYEAYIDEAGNLGDISYLRSDRISSVYANSVGNTWINGSSINGEYIISFGYLSDPSGSTLASWRYDSPEWPVVGYTQAGGSIKIMSSQLTSYDNQGNVVSEFTIDRSWDVLDTGMLDDGTYWLVTDESFYLLDASGDELYCYDYDEDVDGVSGHSNATPGGPKIMLRYGDEKYMIKFVF